MNKKIIRAREIMHQRFCRLDGLATVSEGLAGIRACNGDAVIVNKRNEGDEIGLVLLSDIAKKVMANDRACERVSLYEIMAKPVVSVRPEMDVRYCARLFHNFGLSTAPVLDESGEVMGIVSYRELVLDGLWPESC
jgi:predicted transcriptional regulator